MDRRSVLSTTAAMGMGAVTGCATTGNASTGARTVFAVPQPMLPIVGSSEMFPVRRIYCIGRNYAAHAREMGSDPNREPPFFFQKPSDAVQFVAPNTTADHPYPPLTKNYHYEIELVAALKSGGNKKVKVASFPKLNHLFQTSRIGTLSEYKEIEETIAPPVLETIFDWISKQTK